MAARIEAVAGRGKPSFRWRVTLICKNEANAYPLPDRRVHRRPPRHHNDAALATVLRHEAAHATAEHAAERIEREHLTRIAAGVAFTPGQYLVSRHCSAPPGRCR